MAVLHRFYRTMMSGWSIVYIEGSQVEKFQKHIVFLTPKFDFVLANSEDQNAAFHLGT